MLVVTYKELNKDGLIHLPFRGDTGGITNAKKRADILYKEGYLNVKVVEIEQKVLYEPGVE